MKIRFLHRLHRLHLLAQEDWLLVLLSEHFHPGALDDLTSNFFSCSDAGPFERSFLHHLQGKLSQLLINE